MAVMSIMCVSGCSAQGTLIYDNQGKLTQFKVDRGVSLKSQETSIDTKAESPLKDIININGFKTGQ
jgi:hypothetical protein